MSSIKLHSHQVRYLNQYEGNRRDVILTAIKRFRNGEFNHRVIQSIDYDKNPLVVLPIRKPIDGFSASEIRMILQLHMENTIQAQDQTEELKKLELEYEKYIAQKWKELEKMAKNHNIARSL